MRKKLIPLNQEFEMIRKELKLLTGFDYPKLTFLILAIIASYIIFSNSSVQNVIEHLDSAGYVGAFLAGIFFTFGFTSPFSAGYFITLNPSNIWLAGILGGVGAMLGDLFIFQIIRVSFMDEFERLKRTKIMKKLSELIEKTLGHKIKIYLMYIFAGILIASPLPDEAGVIMLAGLTKIKSNILAIISFILNTTGILILLCL